VEPLASIGIAERAPWKQDAPAPKVAVTDRIDVKPDDVAPRIDPVCYRRED
jgi:hypothetical protein